MDIKAFTAVFGCACTLAWMPAHAAGPEATSIEPASAVMTDAHARPWMAPVDDARPIRRTSQLRTEYRRIRDLRREQMQPEYERRLQTSGEAAAEAWREDTLRNVAKRDLRDLRARLER